MEEKDIGIFVCFKLLGKHLRKRKHTESDLCSVLKLEATPSL